MESNIICPYCYKKMRLITNVRADGVRAYLICDRCASRSPRVRHDFVEDVSGFFVTASMVPKTMELIADLAYEAATQYQYEADDVVLSSGFDEVMNYEFD